ncbi:MAG: hypothetical protein CL840_07480 [Crocinitomicaceae bacterium]|nr:hypothetical protein [Crocinitomicaceae bacterium]
MSFLTLIGTINFPLDLLATSGVDQQTHSTGSVDINQMVDPATGNFKYSIPVLNIEGYPLNLNYSAGITMEQEASWVGLGWSLSPGAISRTVRGLPDDFKGDPIDQEMSFKKDETWGVHISGETEIAGTNGKDNKGNSGSIGLGFGLSENSYLGKGVTFGVSFGMDINDNVSVGLNANNNSQTGINIIPSMSFSAKSKGNSESLGVNTKVGVGIPMNSREGLRGISVSKELNLDGRNPSTRDVYRGQTQYGLVGSTSFLPFGTQSFVPQSTYERVLFAKSVDLGVGGEVKWGTIKGSVKVTNLVQTIEKTSWDNPSYGYLYSEDADDKSILDFNREFSGQVTEEHPRMPFTSLMPDAFVASASGLNLNFRAHRSDVGQVYDPEMTEKSRKGDAGAHVAFGEIAKAGADYTDVKLVQQTGRWNDEGFEAFEFWKEDEIHSGANKHNVETYEFRAAGDQGRTNNEIIIASSGGDDLDQYLPIAPHVNTPTNEYYRTSGSRGTYSSKEEYLKESLRPRNFSITALTAKEASIIGLNKSIKNYTGHKFSASAGNTATLEVDKKIYGEYSPIDRTSGSIYKDHHLHEYSITNDAGVRYVYGNPIYSIKEKEVSFSVDAPSHDNHKTGLITYSSNNNSVSNTRGSSNSFNSKSVPAHATQILLSAVLSSDYVDVTGDGPTPDDKGGYTKFNYSKVNSNYAWRNPYGQNQAKFNPMSYYTESGKTGEDDDMASYIYGEKEIWYLHSIESKNYVAEFTLSTRDDGYGVIDENGGQNTSSSQALKKLDEINLYTRAEKIKAEALGTTATPIKTVHFEYDYSLCQNTPSNKNTTAGETGKLTLKKVYNTYGNSGVRSKLTPYIFSYADTDHDGTLGPDIDITPNIISPKKYISTNPDYNSAATDRWGMYKPEPEYWQTPLTKFTNVPSNMEFPYTTNKKIEADAIAACWNLSTIYTPSGSRIDIDYEMDSYKYVQDKKVMKMYPVKGFTKEISGPTPSAADNLLYVDREDYIDNYFYLWVDISEDEVDGSLSSNEALEYFKENYLGDISSNLLFKMFMDYRGGDLNNKDAYDYVTGYSDIERDKVGIVKSSGSSIYDLAYIKLDEVRIDDFFGRTIHPISKAGFEHAWANLNSKVSPGINPSGTTFSDVKVFEQMIDDFKSLLKGRNHILMKKGLANSVFAARSFVRLYSPSEKFGGGHRVKKLQVHDNWENMDSDGYNSSHGVQYFYQLKDGETTSGVNTYEPRFGGEDNPFKQPEKYAIKRVLANDHHLYMEKPFGEFMLPNPNVMYSRVLITALESPWIEDHSKGHSVNEYYTAKDYPITFDHISMITNLDKPSALERLFKTNSYLELKASQGFVIGLNDMHGKIKSTASYRGKEREKELISKTTYNYKNNLDNMFRTADNNGIISSNESEFSKDIDITLDTRYSYNLAKTMPYKVNFDLSMAGNFPLVLGLPFTMSTKDEKVFKSATISKVISTYGILESTTTNTPAVSNTITRWILDENTRSVIREKSINAFGDELIRNNLPAYYAYSGMSQSSLNEGITVVEDALPPAGVLNGEDIVEFSYRKYFHPGDEVLIYDLDVDSYIPYRYWVVEVRDEATSGPCSYNPYILMNRAGRMFKRADLGYTNLHKLKFKIVRSGRRNHLNPSIENSLVRSNTTNAAMASMFFASKSGINFLSEVLSASANEYSDIWRMKGVPENKSATCAFTYSNYCLNKKVTSEFNPYVNGILGNWRPTTSYVPYLTRNQNRKSTPTQSRIVLKDNGHFQIQPAWYKSPTTSAQIDITASNWLKGESVRNYTENGIPVESSNNLNIFSSAAVGFNSSVIEMKVQNAELINVMSEDFEDIVYLDESNGSPLRNLYTFSNLADPVFPSSNTITTQYDCNNNTFNFPLSTEVVITDNYSHTGKYSLQIKEGKSAEVIRQVGDLMGPTASPPFITDQCTTLTDPDVKYEIQKDNIIPLFSYKTGTKYLISFWLKEASEPVIGSDPVISYNNMKITLKEECTLASLPVNLYRKSNIIDGWQRFEYSVEIPSSYNINNNLKLTFENEQTSDKSYIDDIRIHPFNSQMVTSVFDPITLRLSAELDNSNFATFYSYNEDGQMVTTRVETINGIHTTVENRTSNIKNY